MALRCALIVFFSLLTAGSILNSPSDHFALSIPDLLQNEQQIASYSDQFQETGLFLIKNVLKPQTVSTLIAGFEGVTWRFVNQSVNCWHDKEVISEYPLDHMVNFQIRKESRFVGRLELPQIFSDLYLYEPWLELIGKIVCRQSNCSRLHRSEQHVTSLIGRLADNDGGDEWHFDRPPFGCAFFLQRPSNYEQGGGQFRYFYAPPFGRKQGVVVNDSQAYLGWEWDYDLLREVVNGNVRVHQLGADEVSEGDVYCFAANITFHDITRSEGQQRLTMIMAFSDQKGFGAAKPLTKEQKMRMKQIKNARKRRKRKRPRRRQKKDKDTVKMEESLEKVETAQCVEK